MAPPETKPGDDAAVHPFVNAFANIGAMMGRDLGVVALRAVEAQKGNWGAICTWSVGHIPDTIIAKVPQEYQAALYAVMLIPVGVVVPAFNFVDVEVQAMTVTIIDGSRLVAFVRVAKEGEAQEPSDLAGMPQPPV